jgi:hypothetical protein
VFEGPVTVDVTVVVEGLAIVDVMVVSKVNVTVEALLLWL